MAMEGCHRVIKYILVGFSFLVLLCAGVAIGLGVWALTADYGADEMDTLTGSDLYKAGCIVVIVGGTVVAIVSFLGCCGAARESKCLLGIYFIIMLFFLIVFTVGAVLAFFFYDDLEEELEDRMTDTLQADYSVDVDTNSENKAITDVWNEIQEKLECCGVSGGLNGSKSWFLWQDSNFYKNQLGLSRKLVPSSCCNIGDGDLLDDCQKVNLDSTMPVQLKLDGITTPNPTLYHEGCLDKVKSEIEDHIIAIAAIAVVVLVVMLVCLIFAVCLIMDIRASNKIV